MLCDSQKHFSVSRPLRERFCATRKGILAFRGLRKQFGAMPSDVLAFRGRFESDLERCPARFWRIGSVSKAYECKAALTPGVKPILNRISVSTRMCVQGGSQSIETALTPSVRVTLGNLSIRTPRRGQGRTKNLSLIHI